MADPCTLMAQLLMDCAQPTVSVEPEVPSAAGTMQLTESPLPSPTGQVAPPASAEPLPLWAATERAAPQLATLASHTPAWTPAAPAAEELLPQIAAAPAVLRERLRPFTGGQLYLQRWAALRAGQLYTRMAADSFIEQWRGQAPRPSYRQWQLLLRQEAQAIEWGQGSNRLTVVVGDSLSMWIPPERLPRDRFWLNQGISGDTTAGILGRLHLFADTRPTTIHVMAGINDLRQGASDATVISNLQQIMVRLQQQHPQAQLVVHSILPTRLDSLGAARIQALNRQIAATAQIQGVTFMDLQQAFADGSGRLRREFTTDGLHLSREGYEVWQLALTGV